MLKSCKRVADPRKSRAETGASAPFWHQSCSRARSCTRVRHSQNTNSGPRNVHGSGPTAPSGCVRLRGQVLPRAAVTSSWCGLRPSPWSSFALCRCHLFLVRAVSFASCRCRLGRPPLPLSHSVAFASSSCCDVQLLLRAAGMIVPGCGGRCGVRPGLGPLSTCRYSCDRVPPWPPLPAVAASFRPYLSPWRAASWKTA